MYLSIKLIINRCRCIYDQTSLNKSCCFYNKQITDTMYNVCTYQKPRDDNIKCTASNRKFMFLFLFSQLRSNYTHPMTVRDPTRDDWMRPSVYYRLISEYFPKCFNTFFAFMLCNVSAQMLRYFQKILNFFVGAFNDYTILEHHLPLRGHF